MINRDRLRGAMHSKGLSQAELARRVGASPAAIQQLLNGSSKSSRSIRAIARELQVSVAWLEGDSEDESFRFVKPPISDEDMEWEAIAYFKFSGHDGRVALIDKSGILFSKTWLSKISGGLEARSLHMYSEISNEMSPFILPNDDVLIEETSEYVPDPDAVWEFTYKEKGFLRRLRPLTGDRVSVDADNPQIPSFEASLSDISVHGRAIWVGRRIGP